MPFKSFLLALLLSSIAACQPLQQTSQNATIHPVSSDAYNVSHHALAKRTEVNTNPPFDPWAFTSTHERSDKDSPGDIFRLTKCFCVDTPSRDLPPVYGQFYGSYYGYDYYNYHANKSYSFHTTCASGELETLNAAITAPEPYFLAPKCLSWMEDERKDCWVTDDRNTFCFENYKGKDNYYWNMQKRQAKEHPSAPGTVAMLPGPLNEECQRLCQTVPANTPGYMQDNIPSDHENKIQLAKSTVCKGEIAFVVREDAFCDKSDEPPKKNIPKLWETWNFMETYTDQADMCEDCA